jgi:hypothetical protein
MKDNGPLKIPLKLNGNWLKIAFERPPQFQKLTNRKSFTSSNTLSLEVVGLDRQTHEKQ